MDTRYLKKAAGVLGTAMLMLASNSAQASDSDSPNPFGPVAVHKESMGENWRHSFHDIRTHWDKYFETYQDELAGFESIEYDKVKASPIHYVDRKIQFDIYMGRPGQYFRPFLTPFTQDAYINFTAWPYGTELWTKEGRAAIHPFFYIEKRTTKLCDKVTALPAYAPYRVWAIVRATTENTPWFEVKKIEAIPETPLAESTLRHIELGTTQFAKKRFDLATRSLESALQMQLPVNVELKVYTTLGRAYTELRDYGAARNALCNAVVRDNKNTSNLILLARADLKLQKADEAKQAAEACIAIEPSNALAYAELGLALAWLDDIKGAYKTLEHAQILGRNQLPEAFRNRAMVALRENKPQMARDELNQAVILRPTDVDLKLELGDVYLTLKEVDKAKLEFTQARDLAVNRAEPYYKLALVLKVQGDELQAAGKADDAKKAYTDALENVKQAISKDEKLGAAYSLRSELLKALGLPDEAAPVPTPVIIIKQGTTDAQPKTVEYKEYELSFQQAQLLGDFVAMERLTRNAISAHADAELYSKLGMILATRPNADLNGAIAAYDEAVRRSPDRSQDWAALGNLQLRFQRKPADAEATLNRAVQLDPSNGFAWTDLALARRMQGNPEGSIQAAEKAMKNNALAEAWLINAQSRMDRGTTEDLATALELANTARGKSSSTREIAVANSVAASALMRQGKIDDAIVLYRGSDEMLRDNNAEHQLGYGLALLTKGDATAQDRLKSAMELSRDNATSDRIAQTVFSGAETALRGTAKGSPAVVPVSNNPQAVPTPGAKGAPVIEDNDPVPVVVPGTR